MNVKLTRAQELQLIAIGLNTLLSDIGVSKIKKVPWNKGKKGQGKGRKWSPEQKRKFSETMRKKWANK